MRRTARSTGLILAAGCAARSTGLLLAAGCAAWSMALVLAAGCAGPSPSARSPGTRVSSADAAGAGSISELLEDPAARVMWVGAHPDDETLAGPILARACIGLGRPCSFFVMTRGEGGMCPFRLGCHPDLGAVRAREVARVAAAYGAQIEQHALENAPLPEESFPPRAEIARAWMQQGDPSLLIARAIRRFRPTILLSFDPDRGFTNHPEHQLVSRFARVAVRRAADAGDPGLAGLPPFQVGAVYDVLNRYWIMALVGRSDDRVPTETFDTHVACGAPRRTCLDVALEITRLHRTQAHDMGLVRMLRPQLGTMYLRRVEPLEWRSAPMPP